MAHTICFAKTTGVWAWRRCRLPARRSKAHEGAPGLDDFPNVGQPGCKDGFVDRVAVRVLVRDHAPR
eukprot:6837606-Alexandrium_andersonii.AAC.1